MLCFGLWLVADAPTLQHNAAVGPFGPRRTIALDLVGPIAALSRTLHLDFPVNAVDTLLGRSSCAVCGQIITVGPPVHPGAAGNIGRPGGTNATHRHAHGRAKGSTQVPSPYPPQPTPANPMRMLFVGDSLGGDLANALAGKLAPTNLVSVSIDTHAATGLSRPDYFNWPDRLAADLAQVDPGTVVTMIGGNDAQNFVDNGQVLVEGTPAWQAAYAARVGAFMDEASAAGRHVVWVGMPITANGTMAALMAMENGIYRSQAARHPRVSYVDIWALFADASGHYAAYLPDAGGDIQLMRQSDGVHFTVAGADRLADFVLAAIEADWKVRLG